MRVIYSLILSIAFCLALSAQTVWTGSVDSDWMNPGNWSAGVPTTGMIVTVPGAPFGGNFPIYSGSPVLDFTLQNAGSITFDGFVYNNGTIINFSAGTLINNDNYFVNAGSVIFDNDGSFTNTGTFANFGVFDNAASAVFTNSNGASFINHGLYRNNGLLANNGSVTNYGTIRSTNNFQNNGIVENYGFIDSPFGSIIANNAESLISNFLGSIFTHNGSFQNDGTFENNGRLEVQNASTLTNDGTINNDNDLQISGTLLNNSTVTNNGVATINNGGTLDNKNNFANNNTVETATCAVIIQDSPIDISATVLHDGIIYEIQGQVAEIVLDFGEVFNDLNQTKSPIAGCRSGAVVQLNEDGTGTLDINLVDNGSFGSCGATVASRTLSRDQFTTNDLGDQTVTLTIEDNFGVISTCDAVIFVAEYVPPIEPVDDPNIEFACPGDITISPAQPGEPTVAVNWTEPEVQSTTCCANLPNATNDTYDTLGFTFIGEYNNSRYYRSNFRWTWTDAQAQASANGGFLATINSQGENIFIKNTMIVPQAWIGYTDEASEGNFEWVSGEATTYTNWANGQPNDHGGGEDYAIIRQSSGRWNDLPISAKRSFVMEIPCSSPPPPCDGASENKPGLTFMGEYNDSKYYYSNHRWTWTDAKVLASENGGFLAAINSQEENDFIQNAMVVPRAWIGYTDEASEGNFEWVSGEATTYTNWANRQPNDYGDGEDYAIIRQFNGQWNDLPISAKRFFIIEVPCNNVLPLPLCTDVPEDKPGFIFVGEYNDSKYYFSNSIYNWANAKAEAFANGGFLAVINSQEENDFVQNAIVINNRAWIGYTDEASEGNFEWVNGEETTYTNWFSGVPNHIGKSGTEIHKLSGQWNDIPLYYGRFMIMEIPCDNTPPSSNNGPTVQQISGPPNGADFGVGVTEIAYQTTDACENIEICTFTVTVEENPAEITATCPANIIVNAAPGANDAIVEWTEPTATTTCYRDGVEVTRIDEGPANGEAFPVGVSFVFYTIVDSCNNFQQCLLTITVNAQASALTLVSCPEDITTDANNFTWDLPTASTTCFTGNIEINQIVGPDRGSTPAADVHQIAYLINDDCGNSEVCIFNVTVCSEDGTNCTEAFNFRATRDKRGVQTYWMTNTETQNDHFVVERSSDGVNFKPLLNVKSATNSSGAYNYFEADSNPFQGDNFYRLKKVHHDGSFDYSNVKRITFDLDLSATTVFPNPATNEVFIYLQDFEGKEATISVFNHLGQQMDVKVIDLIESYPIRFDLFKYSGGVYTMYIDIEGTKNFTRKFIISKL